MLFFKRNFTRRIFPVCLIFTITLLILANLPSSNVGAVSPLYARVRQVDDLSASGGGQDNGYLSSHRVRFLNDRARDITGASAVNAPGFIAPAGLTGRGQIVAIADSGLDTGRIDDIHPDLRSAPDSPAPKVTFLESLSGRPVPDDPTGHGTHMAATVAGTGAASGGMFRGIAPGASIYFQAILNADGEPAPPNDLSDLFRPAYQAGARVHIDGWGGGSNMYGGTAAQIDEFVRLQPDFLPVFGAGNSGPSPGTLTAEANSKNALVVGTSVLPRPALAPGEDNTLATATFSSRGPAGDGRIKPELLAPASAVISARSRLIDGNLPGYSQYTQMQGTSMAAAVAGGSAVLLGEYFKEKAGAAPSAALLRAALANGARTPAGGPTAEDFGVIDLASTVIALKDDSFQWADEWAGLKQGEEAAYTYTVTDSSAPFKVTLAWTDPPGTLGEWSALVNDLDLVVEAPDGHIYRGNHFLGSNNADHTNNIEQVYLSSPVAGRYTVRVFASSVRKNTVYGRNYPSQDFAIVWGQPPRHDRLISVENDALHMLSGDKIALDGLVANAPSSARPAASVTKGFISIMNTVDGILYPSELPFLYPGAGAYRTAHRLYLVANLWRATGVRALQTTEGTIFTEINRLALLGGYLLAPEGKIILNGKPVNVEDLPAGMEVTASVNPSDQLIGWVKATYNRREGIVSAVRSENGRKLISLIGDSKTYTVTDSTTYSYEDSFADADTQDIPFGVGALDELEKELPGMPVSLNITPSSGEVQYLAIKRQIVLGKVKTIDARTGTIKTGTGFSFYIPPGVPIKRDGKDIASITDIMSGNRIAAVLKPDSDEAIGLVVFSNAFYGKVVDYSKKNKIFYLLNDYNQYQSFHLSPETTIYRWGMKTSTDALTSGSRIRLCVDETSEEAMRLDVAETFNVNGKILSWYDSEKGVLAVSNGTIYHTSATTRFYKNGQPVLPEFLLPGELVDLEYVTAPKPTGLELISVNAHTSATPPFLLACTLSQNGLMEIIGRSGVHDLYLFSSDGSWQFVPVNAAGQFTIKVPLTPEDTRNLALVAIDRQTGGIEGQLIIFSGGGGDRPSPTGQDIVSRALSPNITGLDRLLPDAPITRAAAVTVLARLLGWQHGNGWALPFVDVHEIPAQSRSIVARAQASGIVTGFPDGTFRPRSILSRAEAAVILARIISGLGLTEGSTIPPKQYNPAQVLNYADTLDIPPWAAAAVAETTGARIFRGRPDGTFAPNDPVAFNEMVLLIDRLLTVARASGEN